MIVIHDSAEAFFSSKKGYAPQIEEAAKVINDAWLEAIRLFHSEEKYSTDHMLNHVSGILDQLMRLAVFGPGDCSPIVLFLKSEPWEHPQAWGFVQEIRKCMLSSCAELSAARAIYGLRNNLSAHGCQPVDSDVVSAEQLKLVQDYLRKVLNHIKLMFCGGDE
jgi:hypothetical protein